MIEEGLSKWHLCETDFFDGLPTEKKAFLALAKKKIFKKDSILFFEEEEGNSCFYIESGILKIFKTTSEGKEPIFFIRKPGEFFGLAEVIDSRPRKANAQTLSSCVIWELMENEFETLFTNSPSFSKRVVQVLGSRIRYLGQVIENLVVCNVTTRLAKLLVYLSIDSLSDEESWETAVVVPVKLTQEQMASMTGSCQQTISETLSFFQGNGLISISKKQITIINPLRLLSSATN